jgi:hypothetical protein
MGRVKMSTGFESCAKKSIIFIRKARILTTSRSITRHITPESHLHFFSVFLSYDDIDMVPASFGSDVVCVQSFIIAFVLVSRSDSTAGKGRRQRTRVRPRCMTISRLDHLIHAWAAGSKTRGDGSEG